MGMEDVSLSCFVLAPPISLVSYCATFTHITRDRQRYKSQDGHRKTDSLSCVMSDDRGYPLSRPPKRFAFSDRGAIDGRPQPRV